MAACGRAHLRAARPARRGGRARRAGPLARQPHRHESAGPFDEAGFLRYARSLRNPEISRVIAEGRPLSRIHGYAVRPNRWRLHHRTASAWAGLLAFGDALFCLNPVYGQGMTVITMQALLLRDLLAEDATRTRSRSGRRGCSPYRGS
ncbi:hypothetical protein ACFQ0B_49550 [Nonomuraea thailandensis]